MPFWAYMLHCNAGRFYTGHTDDLERRVAQHESGAIDGFSKRFLPVALVWSQEFATRQEAKAAEQRIKGWSRKKKLALIRGDWAEISLLAKGKSSPSTSSGRTGVEVAPDLLSMLKNEAAKAHPFECCGILLGHGDQIEHALPARNIHPSPQTHFEIDPQALVDAHRAARAGGPQVQGYYHSHPEGPAEPSATDSAMANRDGTVWAIVGRSGDVAFWRDGEGGFVPLPYNVTDS